MKLTLSDLKSKYATVDKAHFFETICQNRADLYYLAHDEICEFLQSAFQAEQLTDFVFQAVWRVMVLGQNADYTTSIITWIAALEMDPHMTAGFKLFLKNKIVQQLITNNGEYCKSINNERELLLFTIILFPEFKNELIKKFSDSLSWYLQGEFPSYKTHIRNPRISQDFSVDPFIETISKFCEANQLFCEPFYLKEKVKPSKLLLTFPGLLTAERMMQVILTELDKKIPEKHRSGSPMIP